MPKSNKWIFWSVVGIVVPLFGVILLLNYAGFFEYTGSDASAKIIASSLALLGAFFGSVVTVIGIFLKQVIDQRNQDLKEQAEERLRLEAAIQAVNILSSKSGNEVPVTQRAGVLFTLSSLKQTELAVTLLNQMLSKDKIDSESAMNIIEKGLTSGEAGISKLASEIFKKYHAKFVYTDGQCNLPDCVSNNWDLNWSSDCRSNLVEAILKMILLREFDQWNYDAVNNFVYVMHNIWTVEDDESLKAGVGMCLKLFPPLYANDYTIVDNKNALDVKELKKEFENLYNGDINTYSFIWELYDRLSEWAKRAKTHDPIGT